MKKNLLPAQKTQHAYKCDLRSWKSGLMSRFISVVGICGQIGVECAMTAAMGAVVSGVWLVVESCHSALTGVQKK